MQHAWRSWKVLLSHSPLSEGSRPGWRSWRLWTRCRVMWICATEPRWVRDTCKLSIERGREVRSNMTSLHLGWLPVSAHDLWSIPATVWPSTIQLLTTFPTSTIDLPMEPWVISFSSTQANLDAGLTFLYLFPEPLIAQVISDLMGQEMDCAYWVDSMVDRFLHLRGYPITSPGTLTFAMTTWGDRWCRIL